jgi:hypothetical protein
MKEFEREVILTSIWIRSSNEYDQLEAYNIPLISHVISRQRESRVQVYHLILASATVLINLTEAVNATAANQAQLFLVINIIHSIYLSSLGQFRIRSFQWISTKCYIQVTNTKNEKVIKYHK